MQTRTIPTEQAVAPRPEGQYKVNEVFYSIQGEGANTGEPMVFVRFADCNLRCTWSNAGFDCDTEFTSGVMQTAEEILRRVESLCMGNKSHRGTWLLLTGGEPGLSVDSEFIHAAKKRGYRIAIETNGTIALPPGIDYITVSPKSAEHTIVQKNANEVRYVRHAGMGIPETVVTAAHRFISPAFQSNGTIRREDLEWCQKLVLENPDWRLSVQTHKLMNVR